MSSSGGSTGGTGGNAGNVWSGQSIDSSGNLTSVSCPTASLCVAVDQSGNAYTFIDPENTWTATLITGITGGPIDTNGGLVSVSCPSVSFCVAVGSDGNAFTLTSTNQGSTWTASAANPIYPIGRLSSVSCSTANFCVAVDQGGYAYTSTTQGSTWAASAANPIDPNGGLTSVSCDPTANLCVAVDNHGNAFTSTNPGSTWTASAANPIDSHAGGLYSISCPTANFCVAVDYNSDIAFTYNDGKWTSSGNLDLRGQGFNSVSCPTANFCVAVDYNGNVFISTTQGSTWMASAGNPVDLNGEGLISISCPTASLCVAVDSSGEAFTSSPGTLALSITTTSLAAADQGETGYSQTLLSSGGTGAITWSISSGSLALGLSLDSSTGVIAGTVDPSATNETFTVEATDSLGMTSSQSLTITVNPALSISTSSLATANQGETGYSQTLASSGGTAPITWSISSGSLPLGLSLGSSTGAITGTVDPSATNETFTVEATDSLGLFSTESLMITVNPTPSITTSSLAAAYQMETGYSQTLTSSGGTGAITWSIVSGTLPSGLNLDSSTGIIAGTVAAGDTTETFTVGATDANGIEGTESLTLTVNKDSQTVSFTSADPSPVGVGATYTPTATATSGLTVTFSIDGLSYSGVCSISSGVVSFNDAGN